MIYFPILGSLALGAGTILQKTILRKRKINIKDYQFAEFTAITLAILPFIYFFWKVTPSAFETKNVIIFSLVILFSIFANLLTYYSMKWEKVSNLEPAKILEPLFVVLLAILFSFIFGEVLFERNTKIIIPALIAGIALVSSHVKKHHLEFNKYFLAAIAGSFLFALELTLSRLILDFYSPMTFYLLRCATIAIISFAAFKPKIRKIPQKLKLEILAIGGIWVVYRVVLYYGYLNLGVIFTTLMLMLGPIFIYAFARIFLKEKLEWRNTLSAVIIILSILYAILI